MSATKGSRSIGEVAMLVDAAGADQREPVLAPAWPVLAMVAGAVSLILLTAYRDTRLTVGVAIDRTLITLAVVQPT